MENEQRKDLLHQWLNGLYPEEVAELVRGFPSGKYMLKRPRTWWDREGEKREAMELIPEDWDMLMDSLDDKIQDLRNEISEAYSRL